MTIKECFFCNKPNLSKHGLGISHKALQQIQTNPSLSQLPPFTTASQGPGLTLHHPGLGTRLWLSPLTMEPDCVSATVLFFFFFLTPKSLHASPAPCAATVSKGPNDDTHCLGLHTFLFIFSLLIIVTLSTCYTTHPSPYMSHLCPVPPP
jgi:hypothetical protein